MSATTTDNERRPVFGNWQKPRTRGLGRLGRFPTYALFAAGLVSVAIATVSIFRAFAFVLAVLLLFVPQWVQDSMGRSLYERWRDLARFRKHRFLARNVGVGGPLSGTPTAQCWVPGLGAAIELYEGRDGVGNDVVLLHHPSPGHVTAVIECTPPGTALVDASTVDGWVARWGEWLADLGHDGAVAGVQVIVETRPDPGVELANAMERRIAPDAAQFARDTMRNVVWMMPAGASRTPGVGDDHVDSVPVRIAPQAFGERGRRRRDRPSPGTVRNAGADRGRTRPAGLEGPARRRGPVRLRPGRASSPRSDRRTGRLGRRWTAGRRDTRQRVRARQRDVDVMGDGYAADRSGPFERPDPAPAAASGSAAQTGEHALPALQLDEGRGDRRAGRDDGRVPSQAEGFRTVP